MFFNDSRFEDLAYYLQLILVVTIKPPNLFGQSHTNLEKYKLMGGYLN